MGEDSISHVYDPVKRREYYLRNRELKGRKHGSGKTTIPRIKSRAEITKERHTKLDQQVTALHSRLEKLQAALKILVEQAKKRSGVDTSKTSVTRKASASTKTATPQKKADAKPRKLTAAQKKAKAKAQKESRREQAIIDGTASNSDLSSEVKSLNERIKTIQARIEKMHKSGALGSRANTKK